MYSLLVRNLPPRFTDLFETNVSQQEIRVRKLWRPPIGICYVSTWQRTRVLSGLECSCNQEIGVEISPLQFHQCPVEPAAELLPQVSASHFICTLFSLSLSQESISLKVLQTLCVKK